jgi:hypothetical protein
MKAEIPKRNITGFLSLSLEKMKKCINEILYKREVGQDYYILIQPAFLFLK